VHSPNKNQTPGFVVPMAALSLEALPEGPEWSYGLKLDGYRALIIKECLMEARSKTKLSHVASPCSGGAFRRTPNARSPMLYSRLPWSLGEVAPPRLRCAHVRSVDDAVQCFFQPAILSGGRTVASAFISILNSRDALSEFAIRHPRSACSRARRYFVVSCSESRARVAKTTR
jgi:hypothetical protein